jgi:hypothetical protein
MTIPSKPPAIDLTPPKCPHCKGSLGEIRRYSWLAPPWLTIGLVCPHPDCGVLLNVQTVPVGVVPAEDEPPGPRIHH